jgi:hypothetical protein
MRHLAIKYFISVSLILVGLNLAAQNTCTDQLRLAQRRYDGGLLEDIPNMLESCLARGFTQEEKMNAYKLLIQTYLFSDMPEKADEMMLRFLREFPEYRISVNDYREFVNLYKTYQTEPIMKIEASVIPNFSLISVSEFYGVEDLNTSTPEYTSRFGFGVEVNYLDNLFGDFDGSIGISFSLKSIGYWNQLYDFTDLSATYNNFYIGLPLAMRYNKKLMGIDFFAKGGVEPVYLLISSIDFTRIRPGGKDPITGTESFTEFQKRIDIHPLLSIGVDYKIGNMQFLVTTGLKFGTIKPTLSDKRYSSEDYYSKYYFIPDDFFIHQAFFSVSYVFSVYNPKKIR